MKKRILYIDNENDFFGKELAHGFIEEANHQSWWTHWYHNFDEGNISSIRNLLPNVDGVVLRGKSEELHQLLQSSKIPHLKIRAKDNSTDPKTPHVDDSLIGEIAKEEMNRLDIVHRGFIGYKNVDWSEKRGVAFLTGMVNISYLELLTEDINTSDGVNKIIKWLKGLPKPVGIFTPNDNIGIATLIACQLSEFTVPDSVTVIGVDNNLNYCNSISPTLSSIDLHPQSLGKHFAHLMAMKLDLLEEEEATKLPQILPPSLVVRESTHHLNPYLLHYRKSVEWIFKNALCGPSVQELADHFNISRRALERAFKQCQAPPPALVIRKERMRQIKELLLRDNVSQQHIARQANFPDIPSLSNFVKRQTGHTPGDIRKGLD